MTLTLAAPEGSSFVYDEVKTAKGTKSLGQVPLLVWNSLDKAKELYGDDGILGVLDGTSLRVSFQSIARRYKAAGKTDDEIAKAQIDFKPGKRAVGAPTPQSRAANSAKKAQEKLGESDSLQKLLDKVASGELTEEQLQALLA